MRDTANVQNAQSIAVIRTRLPYIDRRALSQAWFSALGMHESDARRANSAVTSAAAQRPAIGGAPPRAAGHGAGAAPAAAPSLRHGGARVDAQAGAPAPPEVRRAGQASTRPTARTAGSLRQPPVHAAFRLELDGGRVHVIVRREGVVLHVVALCSERHVERVRRALALAAEHLRLRGEALAADVRSFARVDGAA